MCFVRKSSCGYLLATVIFVCFLTAPRVGSAAVVKTVDNHGTWSLLGGYGFTHPGMGKTKKWVETVDLIFQHEQVLIDQIGSSWYQGRHSLLVELPVYLVVDPVLEPMVALNFLACWTFTANDESLPYVFGGGGPLYTDAEIQGMGAHLNGNYLFGAGLRYKIRGDRYLKFEYRFNHISNGGRKDPNDPLNSSKILFGITF